MKRNTLLRNILLGIGGVSGLFLLILLFNGQLPLSITETSCSGDNVWIKYTLADEGSRLSQIPDCASNPAGGWVGSVDFYVTSPTGNVSHIGGYTASQNSTQKINCGVSTQDGKTFAGGYVHNDGQGVYQVQVKGTYYLSTEGYSTPHTFQWTDGRSASCVIPATQCPDGTALRQCSAFQTGKYCAPDGTLRDRADICGCPVGMVANGYYCNTVNPATPPDQTNPPSPFPSPTPTPPGQTSGNQTTPAPYIPPTPPVSGTVSYFGISATVWIIILAGIITAIAALFIMKKV